MSAPFDHPRAVCRELGIRPRKRLGQSFLTQRSLAERIVALAPWPAGVEILEIGGGTGVLTEAIVRRFRDVLVVEVDRALAGHLRRRFGAPADPGTVVDGGRRAVRVLEGDARRVEPALVRRPPVGVFGNVPYAITSDLFFWLVRRRALLAGAVVMVQREYAERITARPGTKAYGSLSVFAALHVHVLERFAVGPGVFWPRPKVGSTVLSLGFADPPRGVDPAFLERVVRTAFGHRRKLLRTNLAAGLELPPAGVDAAIADAGAAPRARAEELAPDAFVRLAASLSRA